MPANDSNLESPPLRTPLTEMLGIKHPIILAGMNAVSHGPLVAAVTNAGGLGVLGGLTMTPKMLRQQIADVKANLTSPTGKFGVDLAIPQVGGSARKTNYDYTHGHLPELADIIISEGASLFVSAVGVPPAWLVDKLHAAGIPVMNMCGHPRHVEKALEAGCDLICAQGTEGGGHTGDIASSVLIPMVVDVCRGKTSRLTGKPIQVVAAGGIFDGRGLACALAYGATGVWVGTRFIAATEASAPKRHQEGVLSAGPADTTRTLIYSGRPLRLLKSDYVTDWNENRANEIKELTSQGILPAQRDMEEAQKRGEVVSFAEKMPLLMGQAAGAVTEIKPAKMIVDEMVAQAAATIRLSHAMLARI